MTKRILHIIPTLDRSGAEKQLTLLAAGLSRQEFDVHVCALTRGGPLAEPLLAADIPLEVIGKIAQDRPGCLSASEAACPRAQSRPGADLAFCGQ